MIPLEIFVAEVLFVFFKKRLSSKVDAIHLYLSISRLCDSRVFFLLFDGDVSASIVSNDLDFRVKTDYFYAFKVCVMAFNVLLRMHIAHSAVLLLEIEAELFKLLTLFQVVYQGEVDA